WRTGWHEQRGHLMTRVIIDSVMRAKLLNLAEQLELCDEQGRVLGYYAPLRKQEKAGVEVRDAEGKVVGILAPSNRDLYEDAEVPVTEEEVEELLQQPPGRPLAEILADLE